MTSPLRTQEEVIFPWEIADQIVSIPSKIITAKELENADVIIEPSNDERKNNNFDNLDSLVEMGYSKTLGFVDYIKSQYKKKFISKNNDNIKVFTNLILP